MMEHWLHIKQSTLRKRAERRRAIIEHFRSVQARRPLIQAEQRAHDECVVRYAELVRFLLAVTSADTLLACIMVKARNHKNDGKTQAW